MPASIGAVQSMSSANTTPPPPSPFSVSNRHHVYTDSRSQELFKEREKLRYELRQAGDGWMDGWANVVTFKGR